MNNPSRKPISSHEALTEREALALGRILALQSGDVDAEELTAQRLRLAQAFAPKRPNIERSWLTALVPAGWITELRWPTWQHWGGRTAALAWGAGLAVAVAGVGLGIGKYRSALSSSDARSVELSAEPMRVPQPHPERALARSKEHAPKGVWLQRGRSVVVDGWLQADAEPLRLEWREEGATQASNWVRLEPGARARVLSVSEAGLELSLEHGNLTVEGESRASACEVFAGPYSVRSSDAQYELSWSTETHNFALSVHEGQALLEERVAVAEHVDADDGDATRSGERAVRMRRVVSAGEQVEFGEARRQSKVRALDGRAAKRTNGGRTAAHEVTSRDASKVAPTVSAVTSPSSLPSSVEKGGDNGRWKVLAESGKYREAVAAARDGGFDAVQANASASELLLLADAARLGGAPGQARTALQLLRQKFPSHPNAAIAAFTLGRMAQELDRNDAAALKWYRTYLRQEPQGRMAEGARARVLKGALRVGTRQEVQAAARDYLAHHPSGSSAALARQSL